MAGSSSTLEGVPSGTEVNNQPGAMKLLRILMFVSFRLLARRRSLHNRRDADSPRRPAGKRVLSAMGDGHLGLDDLIGGIKDDRFQEQESRRQRSGVSSVIHLVEEIPVDATYFQKHDPDNHVFGTGG